MPIYEFKCTECENIDELILKSSKIEDNQTKKCTECGCDSVKIVSSNSFKLSGSGWASDRYQGSYAKSEKEVSDARREYDQAKKRAKVARSRINDQKFN